MRVAILLFASVAFPLIVDRPGTIPWLGGAALGGAWVQTLITVLWRPRKLDPRRVVWAMLGADTFVMLLWLAATGGADSPWFILFAAVLVSAVVRLPPRRLPVIGLVTVLGYLVMVFACGQLATQWLETAVRTFFLVLVATASVVIAHDRLKRMALRVHAFELSQEVAQVGSWELSVRDDHATGSRQLLRIFGFEEPRDDLFAAVESAIVPEDRERVRLAHANALADGTAFQHDHRIVRPDGEVRWVHCRGQAIRDESGRVVQIVGSTQDITESREVQQRALLAQKLASLGTLASGVAHELTNPLAYVAASVASARRELASTPIESARRRTIEAALAAAEDGCHRAAEIVRGLNAFSRSDDGPVGSVDLARVIDSALAIGAHHIATRARVVRAYGPAPRVVGSESRLVQVVLNLLVNAAQAVGASSEEGEIHIRVTETGDERVRLEVSDTGTGIAEGDLSRLFDPFFTTKPAGAGTGLGLSICHGIVRDLGGEITVDTAVGQGTTFRVMLPVASAPASPPKVRASEPPESAPRRRARILVVDDEPRYANSLRLLLGVDHHVTIASGGARALSLISEGQRYDLVLCDVAMADMNGIELYEAIERAHPDLLPKIVFLTGGATCEHARAFLAREDVRHLEKPVELPLLERTIDAMMHEAS